MQCYHTDDAPAALGPYSQACSFGGLLFTSGQIAIDPATGKLVEGGFDAQTRQVLANLRAVLASAGCRFSDVIKATIYVTDLGAFKTLNKIYGAVLAGHKPARSTVEVSALPMPGALVEIDFVARLPQES